MQKALTSRAVIEWTVSCLLKLKPPLRTTVQDNPAAQDPRPAFLASALRLWQLLQLLLEGDPRVGLAGGAGGAGRGAGAVNGRNGAAVLSLAGAPGGSVPGSLLASAAACIRLAFALPAPQSLAPTPKATAAVVVVTDRETGAGTQTGEASAGDAGLMVAPAASRGPLAGELCRTIHRCLRVLLLPAATAAGGGRGGGGVMRPSLEQCMALLTALLDVRPWRDGAGAAGNTAAANAGEANADAEKQRGDRRHRPVSHNGFGVGPLVRRCGASDPWAAAAMTELGRAAQQLLASVLFQEAHVGALAELFSVLLTTAAAEANVEPSRPVGAATAAAVAAAGPGTTAEAAAAAAAASSPEEAAAAVAAAVGASGGEAGGLKVSPSTSPSPSLLLPLDFWDVAGRSYHGQLLQVLAKAVAGCSSSASVGLDRSRGGNGLAGGRTRDAVLMLGLPWLLRAFCNAIGRLRRTVAFDAAAAAAVTGSGGGGGSKGKRTDNAAATANGPGAVEDGTSIVTAPSYKALMAAEFNCMAVLSYMLLQPPPSTPSAADGSSSADIATGHLAKKRKIAATGTAVTATAAAPPPLPAMPYGTVTGGAPWRRLALAGLLSAGRVPHQNPHDGVMSSAPAATLRTAQKPPGAAGAYQPTRDLTGAHCAVLAVVAGRLLAADEGSLTAAAPPPRLRRPVVEPVEDTRTPKAKRKAARAAAAAVVDGGEAVEDGCGRVPYGSLGSMSTSLALCAVLDLDHSVQWFPRKRRRAIRTLRAFSELRQLQSLLESLGAAMRRMCGSGSGEDSGHHSTAGGAGDGAAVAAALLVRPEVLAEIRQAIASVPSGQVPAMIDWVTADLQAWCGGVEVRMRVSDSASAAAAADLFLATGALYDTLLSALRLDLATAMPVAKANVRLLTALSPPLLSSMRQYCKSLRAAASAAADGEAEDATTVAAAAAAVATLRLHTARLAMLLRVYGAVVRTNSVCAGLHPEVPALPDQDISPWSRREHQQQQQRHQTVSYKSRHSPPGGYFAPALTYAVRAASAAAADGGITATSDVDGGVDSELRRLRKALKNAGATQPYGTGPLPGLAQLALAEGGAAAGGQGGHGTAGSGAAAAAAAATAGAGWAAVELSKAIHRCLGHRLQVLHERLLRRRHDCPHMYGRASAQGLGDGGGKSRVDAAAARRKSAGGEGPASQAAGPPVDGLVKGAATAERAEEEEGLDEEEEEEEEQEVRLLANLMLTPLSTKAATAAGCIAGGGGRSAAAAASTAARQVCRGGNAVAYAFSAPLAGAAWRDVLALMGSIAPWAERTALTEVLQMALTAACQGCVASGGDGDGVVLRQLQPSIAASLCLLEFQSLPGVRQALPYAWMATAASALCAMATEVRQAVAAAAMAVSDATSFGDGDGSEKRKRSAKKAARKKAGAGAGVEEREAAAAYVAARLDALLAAAAAAASSAAAVQPTGCDAGDGDDDDDTAGNECGDGNRVSSSSKVLARLLTQQAKSLNDDDDDYVWRSLANWSRDDVGAVSEGIIPAGADGATADGFDAVASALRSLLAFLCDKFYLELVPRKAREAMVRQVTAATAAAVDMLLLLHRQPPAEQQQQQQQQSRRHNRGMLQRVRCEVLRTVLACLRAWQRLSVAYGSDGGGGGAFCGLALSGGEDGGEDEEDEEEEEDVDDSSAVAAEDLYIPPRVVWLVRVCRLLVAEAEALDGVIAADPAAVLLPALKMEVVYDSGRLLTALLTARDDGSSSLPKSDDAPPTGRTAQVVARLRLADQLLRQAECTPAATSGGSSSTSVPLLCRLSLAAAEAAAVIAAACKAGGSSSSAGADGGSGGCSSTAASAPMPAAGAAAGGGVSCQEGATATRAGYRGGGGGGNMQIPVDAGLLPELLLRASRWVAAERRLYGTSSVGSVGTSRSDGAAIAAEPLEHCVALMYGIATWLPALGRGGRRRGVGAGSATAAAASNDMSHAGASLSDELLALLVAVQQALLACTAPPERFCYARWVPHTTAEAPCLAASGPRVAKLLAAHGPSVALTLTELLAAVAARVATAADSLGCHGKGNGKSGTPSTRATVEVVLCCAIRCLKSIAAREVTFQLAPPAVTGMLSATLAVTSCPLLRPQPLLPTAAAAAAADAQVGASRGAGFGNGGGGTGSDLYFLHAACCGHFAALVRHHENAVRHCAALLVVGCRELLLRLASWASELRLAQRQIQLRASAASASAVAAAVDGLERCAVALASVYEAVSEHPKTLGKYAPHFLADYVVHAATPLPSLALLMHADDSSDPWVIPDATTALTDAVGGSGGADHVHYGLVNAGGGSTGVGPTLLPQPAHEALRQGAARRAALAQLRKEYDSSYKYSGKV
ncbi:hypothetical protein VOLCADRAFT_97963 [Volvox carteri f. nagariensis]|uniref:Uncharacterized protein n=1 Tax=Volvox carteri f. nagariensis TaxID=3068 RepID=D8UE32_VOLCA|nr:uncharacterized protein VOLCADRAFT_97963 [Volvox carteri f. nagariensis]EFJ42054.1 hypothetical protein VOLCADRAFT_97963 [Volvox carteri f. nagariensis]|eukprot:XP_002956929.1 hypothetical protein VOLCADRAFT_97963 [Volvox carteri f. nagariensis]